MSLEKEIENAALRLPVGAEVRIWLENGSATVIAESAEGVEYCCDELVDAGASLAERVAAAVQWCREAVLVSDRTRRIAEVAHEVNRAYCEALGDRSQVDWRNAPEWQRRSCIDGVAFLQQHRGATPEDGHRNWMAFKAADGWTYGPVKDHERKTHPCLLPYSELPAEQRAKDAIFHAIVRVMSDY